MATIRRVNFRVHSSSYDQNKIIPNKQNAHRETVTSSSPKQLCENCACVSVLININDWVHGRGDGPTHVVLGIKVGTSGKQSCCGTCGPGPRSAVKSSLPRGGVVRVRVDASADKQLNQVCVVALQSTT